MSFDKIEVNQPAETVPGNSLTERARIIFDPDSSDRFIHVRFGSRDVLEVNLELSDFDKAQLKKLEAFYDAITAKAKAKIEGD